MARELNNAAIHNLFESAGRGIPDLDGHAIRVAERGILWSKFAQTPALPPSATPEQVAEWNRPKNYEEWEEALRHGSPANPQDIAAWQQQNSSEDALGQLLRPTTAPTGAAHVQRQAPRRPAPVAPVPAAAPASKPAPQFSLRQTMDSPAGILPPQTYTPGPGDENYLGYTPGPDDPNYTGASKHISSLLKVADYLEKKKLGFERIAAGQSYEQVYTSYQAKGGDKMNIGQKGKADVTQGQYASLLNSGSYLPPNLPETMAVEIRAAIQNGRALGVTVVTTPANPAIASKIDAAVRQIQFTPASEKMDFTTTKFPPAA
jgi:hypothetical protein